MNKMEARMNKMEAPMDKIEAHMNEMKARMNIVEAHMNIVEVCMKTEALTNEMHSITRKTRQETVSMRIITVLTLLFLPGAFIGVSESRLHIKATTDKHLKTFMGIDILKFETNNAQDFEPHGLMVYVSIFLPMTVIIFLIWCFVYRFAHRGQKRNYEWKALASNGYSSNV